MKVPRILIVVLVATAASSGTFLISATVENASPVRTDIARAQAPSWSKDDLNFFLHGSMSTEVFPEPVLRAFIKTYPDLFPASDLTYLGLIPDPDFGWPIGISRKAQVKHLGNLPAVGVNCASCHVAQITSTSHEEPLQI